MCMCVCVCLCDFFFFFQTGHVKIYHILTFSSNQYVVAVLWLNKISTLVGHSALSHREKVKMVRRDSRVEE